jgi:hypothetical protein
VTKFEGSHPMLYDRLIAAGLTPDFPRPDAPSYAATKRFATAIVLVLLTVALCRDNRSLSLNPWRRAFFGTSRHQLVRWAEAAHAEGNDQAELEFLEASLDVDRDDPRHARALVQEFADIGRCDRAAALAASSESAILKEGHLTHETLADLLAACRSRDVGLR